MTFTEAPRDAGRGRVAEAAATAAGRTLPTYLPTLAAKRNPNTKGGASRRGRGKESNI